jgi:hypothetical protein
MHPVNIIKENPVAALGIAVLALIAWVAVDLANPPHPKKLSTESQPTVNELPLPGPPSSVVVADDGLEWSLPLVRTTISTVVLPSVKPGMKRHEVEGFLGIPKVDQIQPMTRANGRTTYSTAYEFDDIGPPSTIRPIQPLPRAQTQPQPPRLTIAFVFDATKPGHPLIDILFPDPLF